MTRLPIVAVVEDDVDLAAVFAEWLSGSYTVRVAHSAEEAREVIDGTIDVALLDRRLPDASGDEILDWIQEREFDTRVAMITAISPDFDVIEMGFDTYVVKPVSRDDIRGVVKMLLTRTIYDKRIQKYFELLSKKRILETEKPTANLDENRDYLRLSRRLDELRAEVDYLLGTLDDEYFAAEMQRLVGRRVDPERHQLPK